MGLKVLPPGALSDEAARKGFRKETLALSKLNHLNIAIVFDFDTQNGADFLVMEYLPETTLQLNFPILLSAFRLSGLCAAEISAGSQLNNRSQQQADEGPPFLFLWFSHGARILSLERESHLRITRYLK